MENKRGMGIYAKFYPDVYKKTIDMAEFLNKAFRKSGIAKGLVSVAEDINSELAGILALVVESSLSPEKDVKIEMIEGISLRLRKARVGIDYMYRLRCLTDGEVKVLAEKGLELAKMMEQWKKRTREAV